MLVGNKSDLTDQRIVRKEMGSELANYKNMAVSIKYNKE